MPDEDPDEGPEEKAKARAWTMAVVKPSERRKPGSPNLLGNVPPGINERHWRGEGRREGVQPVAPSRH